MKSYCIDKSSNACEHTDVNRQTKRCQHRNRWQEVDVNEKIVNNKQMAKRIRSVYLCMRESNITKRVSQICMAQSNHLHQTSRHIPSLCCFHCRVDQTFPPSHCMKKKLRGYAIQPTTKEGRRRIMRVVSGKDRARKQEGVYMTKKSHQSYSLLHLTCETRKKRIRYETFRSRIQCTYQ